MFLFLGFEVDVVVVAVVVVVVVVVTGGGFLWFSIRFVGLSFEG